MIGSGVRLAMRDNVGPVLTPVEKGNGGHYHTQIDSHEHGGCSEGTG